MNRIRHQIEKDFSRVGLYLLLCLIPIVLKLGFWIAIRLIAPGLGALDLSLAHTKGWMALIALLMSGGVLMGVSLAIPYVIIPLIIPILVHDDPLVGTTAFWLTRPVSRREMLYAKLLSVGGMIMLLVIDHSIPIPGAVPSASGLAGLGSFTIKLTSLLVLIMFFSSITDSLKGIFGAIMKTLLLWWVIMIVVEIPKWVMTYFKTVSGSPTEVSHQLNITVNQDLRAWSTTPFLIVLVGGLGLIYHQFITRRTGRTVQIAIAMLVVFSVVRAWI